MGDGRRHLSRIGESDEGEAGMRTNRDISMPPLGVVGRGLEQFVCFG